MLKPLRLSHPLIKIFNNSLIDLPSPARISYIWNFGSLLGLSLSIQIVTGLFLAIHYTGRAIIAFESIIHISRDVNTGWLIRILHANGASIFFIILYIHVGRGIYFGSYKFTHTWITGVVLILLLMMTAFVGYVLPWGQISFWGATVITKLLTAIPYLGVTLVYWLWGAFAVDNATLTRFFTFHFILPFILIALVIIHLIFLHQTGSSSPLGLPKNQNKTSFHPYFSLKDSAGILVFLFTLLVISSKAPFALGDVENFILANPITTPLHIQPEWYFLFAYAILRSIPNKLGGVVALGLSIIILLSLPFSMHQKHKSIGINTLLKFSFWGFVTIILLLTWIGARPVEEPFIIIGQILSVIYFIFYLATPLTVVRFNNSL